MYNTTHYNTTQRVNGLEFVCVGCLKEVRRTSPVPPAESLGLMVLRSGKEELEARARRMSGRSKVVRYAKSLLPCGVGS